MGKLLSFFISRIDIKGNYLLYIGPRVHKGVEFMFEIKRYNKKKYKKKTTYEQKGYTNKTKLGGEREC